MLSSITVQGSGVPKEVTPDGQVLRATTPDGASPIIGLVALHLQNPCCCCVVVVVVVVEVVDVDVVVVVVEAH